MTAIPSLHDHGIWRRIAEGPAWPVSTDEIDLFLAACTAPQGGAVVSSRVLYGCYLDWAASAHLRASSPHGFGIAMRKRGYACVMDAIKQWLGLRLKGEATS